MVFTRNQRARNQREYEEAIRRSLQGTGPDAETMSDISDMMPSDPHNAQGSQPDWWPTYRDTDDTHRHRLDDDKEKTEVVMPYTRREGAKGHRRVRYRWRS